MLQQLKALFEQDKPDQQPNEQDIQLAAASLMFELIRSDGSVDDVEIEQLGTILCSHFNLKEADVDALIDDAKNSAEEAISLHGFTRKICDSWNNEQRVQLIENLWVLALADQTIDAHERHLVRKVAGLLYLTDRQINVAQETAKQTIKASQ